MRYPIRHLQYLKLSLISFLLGHVLIKNESGQLMSRLTDDTKVINEFISQKLPNLLPSAITIIGSFVMLFIMDC